MRTEDQSVSPAKDSIKLDIHEDADGDIEEGDEYLYVIAMLASKPCAGVSTVWKGCWCRSMSDEYSRLCASGDEPAQPVVLSSRCDDAGESSSAYSTDSGGDCAGTYVGESRRCFLLASALSGR